ncbi:PAS domain S-box protein [Mariprofundus erugo]|nr:PAS domain S-box protein [Mariprofundus erugo]
MMADPRLPPAAKKLSLLHFKVLLEWHVWRVPLLLAVILIAASFYNYLLFHTLAELFTIVVAVVMFVVAAYSGKHTHDNFIMYLSTGYFWVAAMDLIHTLLYKGMAIYPVDVANNSTQFWIASRYAEALLLLSAPLLCNRWQNNGAKFTLFGAIAAFFYALIMSGYFPDAYIEGEGLTRFKIISEYIICVMLALALLNIYYHQEYLKTGVLPYLLLSIVLTIAAELAFTNYVSVYSEMNILGHLLRLFSFWLILHSIVRSSLHEPYEALDSSRALLQGLRDGIPDLIFYKDNEGVYVGCNQAFCDFVGKHEEADVIGRTDFDLFDRELAQFFRQNDREMLTSGEARQNDEWVSYPDGSRHLLDTLKTPFLDRAGRAIGLIGISRDITEKVRAQRMLEQERLQAQRYLDIAAVMLVALDNAGKITLMNKKGCHLLGYQEEEVIGRDWFELCMPDDTREKERLSYLQLMHGKGSAVDYDEAPVVTKDGRQRLIAFHQTLLSDSSSGITGMLFSGEDMTARKNTEGRLRKLSRAIEQAGEAMVITDSHGTIEYINPAFTRVTGYLPDDVIGKNPRLLKSGRQDDSFYQRMWTQLSHGEVWQGKLIDRKKDGSLYPAMLTISPMVDDTGAITHYIGIQQDLTEYERLQEQFHHSQKMEAVGTLIGGIAHDFNNTLAGITGNLYLAKKAAGSLPDVVARLSSVEAFAFRASKMIHQLLTFSRKGEVAMNPIAITPFLKEVIKLQQVAVPENIRLTYQLDEITQSMSGDINLLQQVLINIINNARDAVEGVANPAIVIELKQCSVDAQFLTRHPEVTAGELACITIRDNGHGMSAELAAHIFEPFFTTKGIGKGTGLGLAMVFGAVQSHGGVIEVDTEPEHGTAFHVYLPLEAGKSVDTAVADELIVEGKGEMILLADDESTLLATGRHVLESLGYRVLTATDGLQAVDLYMARQADIDLLILDVVMPNLGGVEAFQKIRRHRPDVKVLFATGYDKSKALTENGHVHPDMVISKPYSIARLSRMIRSLLDGDSARNSSVS